MSYHNKVSHQPNGEVHGAGEIGEESSDVLPRLGDVPDQGKARLGQAAAHDRVEELVRKVGLAPSKPVLGLDVELALLSNLKGLQGAVQLFGLAVHLA